MKVEIDGVEYRPVPKVLNDPPGLTDAELACLSRMPDASAMCRAALEILALRELVRSLRAMNDDAVYRETMIDVARLGYRAGIELAVRKPIGEGPKHAIKGENVIDIVDTYLAAKGK